MKKRDNQMQWIFTIFLALVCGNEASINLSHTSAIKQADESFLVTCKDMSGRQVTWSGPKGPLNSKTRPEVRIASWGTSITFNKVSVKDSGTYTCSAGQDRKVFHLNVKAPLTFMDTSPVQTGKEFSPVTLRCEVRDDESSGDRPIVSWSVENGTLYDPRFQVIGDGLLITNVTRADSRIYICKAMQTSTGDIREQRIQLKVEHQPTFRQPVYAKSEAAWGFIGGEVNLTCEVDAEPPPTFEWFRKHHLLTNGIINVNPHKSILQVYVKDATAFGSYVCKVKNKLGTLEKFFMLQQGIQARPPEFIELRGANSDLLDIGIHGTQSGEKVPASMEPQGYRLEFKAIHEDDWKYLDFPISPDNSYPLQHLVHDMEYEVRAATMNKAGLSVFTNSSTFRTLTSQTDDACTSFRTTTNTWLVGIPAVLAMYLSPLLIFW